MEDFILELENNLSNVGAKKLWKRQVGATLLWLAPITLSGQERVNEVLSNSDSLGMNVVNETKRVTLAYAMVGINDLDLREYRDSTPRFPHKGKDGKTFKVSLDKYLYFKMQDWSSQFIDDAFSIYADLLETDQKENLKGIKFENALSPTDELLELERRSSEIRQQLNMPLLVEPPNLEAKEYKLTDQKAAILKETDSKPVVELDFDPFARVVSNLASPAEEKADTAVKAEGAPDMSVTSPAQNFTATPKGAPMIDVELISPFASQSNTNSDVIDKPSEKLTSAPIIDPQVINVNPRFSPPLR